MSFKKIACAVIVLAGFFVGLPSTALAASETVLLTTLTPKTPVPGEPLNIRLKSFIIDLDSSTVTWYIDGEVVKSGLGATSIDTVASELGTTMKVDVIIIRPDGVRFDKTIKITPIEVDIFWEADTYTPSFYKGKALPTFKSDIRIIAIPRTKNQRETPISYHYEWLTEYTKTIGAGLGRNTVVLPGTWPNSSQIVSVTVKSPADESVYGRKDIEIGIVDPEVRFYEYSQIHGLKMNRAFAGSYSTKEDELQVRAIPYFVSASDHTHGSLIYSWYLNNRPSATPSQPDLVLLSRNNDDAQKVNMTLEVQNPEKILQIGKGAIDIEFQAK